MDQKENDILSARARVVCKGYVHPKQYISTDDTCYKRVKDIKVCSGPECITIESRKEVETKCFDDSREQHTPQVVHRQLYRRYWEY